MKNQVSGDTMPDERRLAEDVRKVKGEANATVRYYAATIASITNAIESIDGAWDAFRLYQTDERRSELQLAIQRLTSLINGEVSP